MVLCHHRSPIHEKPDKGIFQYHHFCRIDPCKHSKIIGSGHLAEKRARKFRCRSKRIRQLAQPRTVTQKYCHELVKPEKPTVEIIRTYEDEIPTRIKMLAYPKVRRLLSARNEYKAITNRDLQNRYEDLIQRSIMTMYSRLANVHLPEKVPHKKWTKADWKRHCEWLKTRALPKTEVKVPEIKRKIVPIEDLVASMYHLSRPRHQRKKYRPFYGYKRPVKEAALRYEPTERILKLATLKKKDDVDGEEEESDPFQVNPRALRYQPTERVKELAKPRQKVKTEDQSQFTESGVVRRALKAKSNPRIVELAKPREKDDEEEEKPLVNPKALKAKPTPRILELAKPRVPPA